MDIHHKLCDFCGEPIEDLLLAVSIVIKERVYDACSPCDKEIDGQLAGKGRPAPPMLVIPNAQPFLGGSILTPGPVGQVYVPTAFPHGPTWDGNGTLVPDGTSSPTITYTSKSDDHSFIHSIRDSSQNYRALGVGHHPSNSTQ